MMAKWTVRVAGNQSYGPADEEVLVRWAEEGRVPSDAVLVGEDGSELGAMEHPRLRPILSAPPTRAAPMAGPDVVTGREPASGLIPYKNVPALVGYYVAVASLIPVAALLLGPAAVVLGVMGMRVYRREPARKGFAHSVVAIVLGLVTGVGNAVLIVMAIAAGA